MEMNQKTIIVGAEWIWNLLYSSELCHYGIKGMKWGVRRTPEELGHKKGLAKSKISSIIIEEAIRTGKVKTKINREKQLRHTKTHHTPGRSYLNGDLDFAQALVDKLSGTGEAVTTPDGRWLHKERVSDSRILGVHVNDKTCEETKTKSATIVYSKTGTHIFPRKKNDD